MLQRPALHRRRSSLAAGSPRPRHLQVGAVLTPLPVPQRSSCLQGGLPSRLNVLCPLGKRIAAPACSRLSTVHRSDWCFRCPLNAGAAPQLPPPPPLLAGGVLGDAAGAAGADLAQPPYSPQPTVSPPPPGLPHQPAASPPLWPLSSASPTAAAAGSPRSTGPAGSIARPLAPGWRPPPIPVPTLLGAASSKSMPASASSKSLGEDFSM